MEKNFGAKKLKIISFISFVFLVPKKEGNKGLNFKKSWRQKSLKLRLKYAYFWREKTKEIKG